MGNLEQVGHCYAILYRTARNSALDQRWPIRSERSTHVSNKRKNFSGRGEGRCKGPETGTCSTHSKNYKEASVAGIE